MKKRVSSKLKDLRGMTFGSLLVRERAEDYISNKGQRKVSWDCICICGRMTTVTANSLQRGTTLSCGCNVGEDHGLSSTPTYKSYINMLHRGESENYPSYRKKNITVCETWRESYLNFLEDMGERPSVKHTLDRIDPDGDYCKENCRWTDDPSLQSYNTSKREDNTSGRTGVSWCDYPRLAWNAYISKDGKRTNLGYFKTLDEACKAREQAELELYGFTKE